MKPSGPRVSVGVPVYNGERFLAQTLDSLLKQTFEDFELVISDNASTDSTAEIARSYAATDRRVRYARNERNLGAARNYRRTLELSSGAYFRWAPADDLAHPELLARCVDVLDRESAVVLAYPKTRFIDAHARVIADDDVSIHLAQPRASERFRALLERLRYCNALYGLMRADVLKRTRLLGSYFGCDIVFQAELVLYGIFWEVPEFLFYRRLHETASSNMNWDEVRKFWNPDDQGRLRLYALRHLWEHGRSIQRAPLHPLEKVRAAVFLARMAISARDRLMYEVREAVRMLITNRPGLPMGSAGRPPRRE